jgi:hypothetical protein
MTAITHAVTAQGAQVWHGLVRLGRGIGDVLETLNAAIRVASAIEMRQQPSPADMKALHINGPLPRYF